MLTITYSDGTKSRGGHPGRNQKCWTPPVKFNHSPAEGSKLRLYTGLYAPCDATRPKLTNERWEQFRTGNGSPVGAGVGE